MEPTARPKAFYLGQRVRVVTASGLNFRGPIIQLTDDTITIRDEKTDRIIEFSRRVIERIEEV